MLESLNKQLKARRLITQRAKYARNDDTFIAPRMRWP
jgi:hypothetical protein